MRHEVKAGWALLTLAGLVACGGTATLNPASTPPASQVPPSTVSASPAGAAQSKPSAATSNSGQRPERDHIKLTYATAGGEDLFTRLAADKGLFQKYGLTVDVEYAQTSVGTAALTSGEVQMNVSDGVDIIQGITSGVPLKLIAYFAKHSPYGVFGNASIKQLGDLRGKSFAIGKLGDPSDVSLRIALKSSGLDATKDLNLQQVGNSPARWGALSSGQVEAAILDQETYEQQAKSKGLNLLASLTNQPYVATAVVVQDSFAKANPKTVEAALRGMIDGIRYFADEKNQADVLPALAKEMKLDPGSPLIRTGYDAMRGRLSTDPYPDTLGVQTLLDALKQIDPARYGPMTPDKIIDTGFMDKIRASTSS